MKRVPVADLRIERLLTTLRQNLLTKALQEENLQDDAPFITALAHQCFINEYVYAVNDEEQDKVDLLKKKVESLLTQKQDFSPSLWLLAGCYEPLKNMTWAEEIPLPESGSDAFDVYSLQIIAPSKEKALSEHIPTLTEMCDIAGGSSRVR